MFDVNQKGESKKGKDTEERADEKGKERSMMEGGAKRGRTRGVLKALSWRERRGQLGRGAEKKKKVLPDSSQL